MCCSSRGFSGLFVNRARFTERSHELESSTVNVDAMGRDAMRRDEARCGVCTSPHGARFLPFLLLLSLSIVRYAYEIALSDGNGHTMSALTDLNVKQNMRAHTLLRC